MLYISLATQAAMVYGASPDFDTMINQLKLLTGRFCLINEYALLENVIEDATAKIYTDKSFESEGATFITPVTYLSDLYKAAEPANRTITYKVKFIRKTNKWVFENINITQG